MSKLRIAVLVSGSGSNLQAIIDACDQGGIDGEIILVGSDNQDAFGLERARRAGIETFHLPYEFARMQVKNGTASVVDGYDIEDTKRKMGSHAKFLGKFDGLDRVLVEKVLLMQMQHHRIDLLVLAGFMRILTPYFIDLFNTDPAKPRIMNIHPALLPSFPGTSGYEDAWNYGSMVYGPTVHFIDYGEDTGPIIGQVALQRQHDDTFDTFRQRGLAAEHTLYPLCIQFFATGSLKLFPTDNGRYIVKIEK